MFYISEQETAYLKDVLVGIFAKYLDSTPSALHTDFLHFQKECIMPLFPTSPRERLGPLGWCEFLLGYYREILNIEVLPESFLLLKTVLLAVIREFVYDHMCNLDCFAHLELPIDASLFFGSEKNLIKIFPEIIGLVQHIISQANKRASLLAVNRFEEAVYRWVNGRVNLFNTELLRAKEYKRQLIAVRQILAARVQKLREAIRTIDSQCARIKAREHELSEGLDLTLKRHREVMQQYEGMNDKRGVGIWSIGGDVEKAVAIKERAAYNVAMNRLESELRKLNYQIAQQNKELEEYKTSSSARLEALSAEKKMYQAACDKTSRQFDFLHREDVCLDFSNKSERLEKEMRQLSMVPNLVRDHGYRAGKNDLCRMFANNKEGRQSYAGELNDNFDQMLRGEQGNPFSFSSVIDEFQSQFNASIDELAGTDGHQEVVSYKLGPVCDAVTASSVFPTVMVSATLFNRDCAGAGGSLTHQIRGPGAGIPG